MTATGALALIVAPLLTAGFSATLIFFFLLVFVESSFSHTLFFGCSVAGERYQPSAGGLREIRMPLE
jgi:hypothetical protein